jgi:5-(carboxyamino)imidazole ribonucleotide synthase
MDRTEAGAAWEAVRGAPSILEAFVDFEAEFSILLCRSASGETVAWDSPRTATSAAF